MRHFMIRFTSFTALLSMLLCGSVLTVSAEPDQSTKKATEVTEEKAKAKKFDTGVFTGTAPAGWKYFKVEDPEAEEDGVYDKYAAAIYKGAKKRKDQMITAGIEIRVCEADDYKEDKEQKKLYKKRKDVEFTTGGRTWTGYTGTLNKFKSIVLECEDDDVHWSVTGIMEAYDSSFTVKDKDFRKILSSLKYSLEKKEEKEEKEEKVHKHNYQFAYSVTPQCYTDGYDVYECNACGETETRNYQSAAGHNYVYDYTENPTCYRNGYDIYVCSMCGEIESRNIRYATDHNYVYQYQVERTCLESGYEVWKCIYCDEEDWRFFDQAFGHVFYYNTIDSLYHTIQCYNCGYYNEDKQNVVHRYLPGLWIFRTCGIML